MFHWEKLDYTTPAGSGDEDRTYGYASQAMSPDPESEGWTVTLREDDPDRRLQAGTYRYRFWIEGTELIRPARQWGAQGHDADPAASPSLTSCTDEQRGRGEALHLLVREGRMPADGVTSSTAAAAGATQREYQQYNQTDDHTREFLRWMTALLEVPYESGGHWIGGKLRTQQEVDQAAEEERGRTTREGNAVRADHLGAANRGYGGYGCDCSGLPSAAAVKAGLNWDQHESDHDRPSWRRDNFGRHCPHREHNYAEADRRQFLAELLVDPWNEWRRRSERGRWDWRSGSNRRTANIPEEVNGVPLEELIRPGDMLSSGPGAVNAHVRTIYEIISRGSGDARIQVIEASNGARKVHITVQISLRAALAVPGTMYGIWRPLMPEHAWGDQPASSAAGDAQAQPTGASTGDQSGPASAPTGSVSVPAG